MLAGVMLADCVSVGGWGSVDVELLNQGDAFDGAINDKFFVYVSLEIGFEHCVRARATFFKH